MKLNSAAVTANGKTDPMDISQRSLSNIGVYTVYVLGTFDGATVTIQASPLASGGDATYNDVDGGALTSGLAKSLQISGSRVRASVTGVGGTTSLDIYIE